MPPGDKAVGRLVEDEYDGFAKEGGGDAEPLSHAQRVVTDPPRSFVRRQADRDEQLPDTITSQTICRWARVKNLPAGTPDVLCGGIHQYTDLETGVRQIHIVAPGDGCGPRRRADKPDEDPHGGGLPTPLGPKKPVTRPGRAEKLTSSTAVNAP